MSMKDNKVSLARLKELQERYFPKAWFPRLEECESLVKELIALRQHKELSDAVIEACEYHKKELPESLREKLDFWFEQYKIDESV